MRHNLLFALVLLWVLFPQVVNSAIHGTTGLPLTGTGWTDFATMVSGGGYNTARVIFVDSVSGDDGTAQADTLANVTFDSNGIFQSAGTIHPYQTLATAYAQMRADEPDIMLLKRGSEWSTGLGVTYLKSGDSQTTPHIIASYGPTGNRPKLTDILFNTSNASFVFISGLHFYSANWTTAARALDIRWLASYQTFEDLYIEQKAGDIVAGTVGSSTNIAFRRCIWLHNAAHDGQLFASGTTNLLLEENIFSTPYDESYTNMSRYGRHLYFYFSADKNLQLRGNIFFASDREGADLRWGGVANNNLFMQSFLRMGDEGTGTREIASGNIFNNVLLEASPRTGVGTQMTIIANDGTNIYNNIKSDNSGGINIMPNLDATPALPLARNIDIYDNIVSGYPAGNGTGIYFSSLLTDLLNLTITGNDLQLLNGNGADALIGIQTAHLPYATFANNRYYSTTADADWFNQGTYAQWITATGETGSSNAAVTYTDPSRTLRSYNQTLGGTASTEEFMAEALNQSRQNWRPEYTACAVNNYIREGFDKDAVYCGYENARRYAVRAVTNE